MTIQDIINMAKYGELKQLPVANDDIAVISFINLGLIELYKRFILKTEEIIITLGVPTVPEDDYQMISDTIYELPANSMYIVDAYEEDGVPIPINEEKNLLTINTVAWNRIQVPTPTFDANISIIYVASPILFTKNNLEEQLPIPAQLFEALLHYIGYRAHGSFNGLINAENNTHYQRFERSCNKAKEEGLITADGLSTINRLNDKGFA